MLPINLREQLPKTQPKVGRTCHSIIFIYHLSCKNCPIVYIEEIIINKSHFRMNNNRSDYKQKHRDKYYVGPCNGAQLTF